jgi:hypothetical protein
MLLEQEGIRYHILGLDWAVKKCMFQWLGLAADVGLGRQLPSDRLLAKCGIGRWTRGRTVNHDGYRREFIQGSAWRGFLYWVVVLMVAVRIGDLRTLHRVTVVNKSYE